MPLVDLSLVTQALLRTLEENIEGFAIWPAGEQLTVSPQPPDKLKGKHALGLYLYHARETAHTKSQDWPLDDEAPQRYTPMGLSLYYLLTARSEIVEESQQIFDEQRMMGLALKTFRDFSRLDQDSRVRGVQVFPVGLQNGDNVIRLLLQPIQFNEAIQYWTVGSQALRFAAYYEVAATLLEPERPVRGRGRVLSYGVQVFLRPAPRLDAARNTIQVTLPGTTTPRAIDLDPAEATYLDLVEFFGTDLVGDRTELLLSHDDWDDPVAVDAAWALDPRENRVSARVQEMAAAKTVLPGIYGASVRTTVFRAMPDGRSRAFETQSNIIGFAIAPRVTALPAALAPGVTGVIKGRRFDPLVLTGEAIRLFIGPTRLERRDVAPAANGEFRVVDAGNIEFRLPAGVVAGETLPLHLVVNGVESAPRWISVS